MDRFWNTLLITPLLAATATASRAATAEVPLRYLSSEGVAAALEGTPGLDGMTMHLHRDDFSVSLNGTDAGIAEAKSRIAAADVPVTPISIKAKVVRFERDENGKVTERTVLAPLFSTLDHLPLSLTWPEGGTDVPISSFTLTPILNQDGTVTLTVSVDQPAKKGATFTAVVATRRLQPDTTVRFLGIMDSDNKPLRRAVESGQVVTDLGPYTAIYLDVSVHRVPENAEK